jgi:hypothetical protein
VRKQGRVSRSLVAAAVVAITGLAAGAGCRFMPSSAKVTGGGGGGSAAVANAVSLRIDPAMATLTEANGVAATQQLKALAKLPDGSEQDVTDQVSWSTDDVVRAGVSQHGLVTTSAATGGLVTVTAGTGNVRGSAALTILLESVFKNTQGSPALPAAPATAFAGPASSSRAPQLVYPNDGVLLPPNLGSIEVHFRPGAPANTLFEIGFANAVTDVRVYTRCVPLADGCVYATTPEVWSALAGTNRGGAPVTLTVRGTDDAGAAVGSSAPFHVRWSRDPLMGALYYWTTTTPIGILRWNFGDPNQTVAEKVVDPSAGDGQCIGCHALSRDGAKMVMTSGNDDVGQLLLFDPVRKAPLRPFPLPGQSWFEAWNADGTAFAGVDTAGELLLFDGTTGTQTSKIDIGGAFATHPDWCPDGQCILFTEEGMPNNPQQPWMGGISYVQQQAGGGWSARQRLVPSKAGVNRYYPNVAVDGTTVVFNESTCPDAGSTHEQQCDGDVDPSARLWAAVMPAAGRTPAAPVELATANTGGVEDHGARDLTTTYAKWSPFSFQLSEEQSLLWVSFSSSRQYGLRSPTTDGEHHGNPSGVLIWLAGVDPRQVAAGQDGSFPAFCLPFQSLATSNHIAQWATGVPTVP